MNNSPKRRKCKDNPYILDFENKKIKFKDSNGNIQEVNVSDEVFDIFNQNELSDISYLHKVEKHIDLRSIDGSELMDITIYNLSVYKEDSIESIVENKDLLNMLKDTINELPETQKRRIKKYFFENKTFEQIAIEENCTKRAVKFSVDIGIENISKKIKN